jgi:molybdopterin-guanine dinucleotide biosynthesis protein A
VYDAIVLAGGSAQRFGGLDKVMAEVGGMSLLDRVLAACAGARSIVVVGRQRPVRHPVRWTLENPAGTGPLAGIAAGVAALPPDADTIVVLAADLPYLSPATVARLRNAQRSHDAALLTDTGGRWQPLAGAYNAVALRRALATLGNPTNRPVQQLVDQLRIVPVPDAYAARDCDTPEQLNSARAELVGGMTLDEWVAELRGALGVEQDVALRPILDLARVAAHNIERPAAPVTTFLAGYAAGLRGGSPEQVAEALRTAADLASAHTPVEH